MPRYTRKEHRFNQGIEEKHCSKCDTWQPLKAYSKNKLKWDNLGSWCRTCSNARGITWNRERYATEEGRERLRAIGRKSMKKRRMNGKLRAYQNKKYKEDLTFRTKHNMRRRILRCFTKHGVKKTANTSEIMGCTPEFLNAHLEKYFTDEMSWENREKWHIDHDVPCCAFGATIEEQKILHWYENLRPMLAKENISKSGTYKEEDKIALIERYNKANNTNYMDEYLKK
mgnify:CR=1 FL=1|tara:strand:- start:2235 stop:2918 length:684 start_codon:yes stop_codon:yes gene_type:complete